MAVVITGLEAHRDMIEILYNLVTEAGRRVAQKYDDRFNATLSRLADFPTSGVLREAPGQNIWLVFPAPYVIVYRYVQTKNTVTILRIVHAKRSMTRGTLFSGH